MARPTVRRDGIPMTAAERKRRQRANPKKRRSENYKARKRYRASKQDTEARRRREASRNAPPLPDGAVLRIGDCREELADIPDNSVPLILTDPPYGNAAELLYRWLAEFAARVLIPGGALICYTGHTRLPRDQAILGAQLTYHHQCIVLFTQPQRLFGRNMLVSHRQVLFYTKGPSRHRSLMPDVWISPKRDKLAHVWAQGEGGVWVPIEHLTAPGELILDPFAGTGTWGRIATQMGRRWIGVDIAEGGTETIAA